MNRQHLFLLLACVGGMLHHVGSYGRNDVSPSLDPVVSVDSLERYDARFLVQFLVGSSRLDLDYQDNYYAMEELRRFFDMVDISLVDRISVIGSTSPEGSRWRNDVLAMQRGYALRDALCDVGNLTKNSVRVYARGDTWSEMIRLIERDEKIPYQSEVLVVLGVDIPEENRLHALGFLEYPGVSAYMKQNIYPLLRNAQAVVVSYRSKEPFVVHDSKQNFDNRPAFVGVPPLDPSLAPALDQGADTVSTFQPTRTLSWGADSVLSQPVRVFTPRVPRALFALKTNLLYDAATILNVSIEVPIGKRWSVAAEYVFPWWLEKGKQHALQVLYGTIEGRYWFPPKLKTPSKGQFNCMTGWFVGVYAMAGYYDLEYAGKGLQGESLLSVGVTGGYAHSIGRNLRMEYSLGVGYMQTQYRSYEERLMSDDTWHLVRQNNGVFSWFGPTQAKISLVWMLHTPNFRRSR